MLLKDLPHAKAGTIFEGTDEGLVNTFQYATGTKDTYHLHTYIHQEWIKAVEEEQETINHINGICSHENGHIRSCKYYYDRPSQG